MAGGDSGSSAAACHLAQVKSMTIAETAETFVSLVVPVPAHAQVNLDDLIRSLITQGMQSWQLVVVGSSIEHSPSDPRLVFIDIDHDQSLEQALTIGLKLAFGRFITFLGPNDVLAPNALAVLQRASQDSPESDVLYTNEGYRSGQRPFVKPSHSPERLRSQNYWGLVSLFKRELIERIGLAGAGAEGAELYDLALRASRVAASILNVNVIGGLVGTPGISALWYPEFRQRRKATIRSLEAHLAATGGGRVEEVGEGDVFRTSRIHHGNPLVSIVIPTRGSHGLVRGVDRCMVVEAVRSVMEKSTYTNFEFVIVIDAEAAEDVRGSLRDLAGARLRFVDWSRPFSFSDKMNLGVVHARGEYLLLLNDDVELITPDWIERLLALAQLPKSGLVGAMLYFEDDTIQHAGHAYYRLDVTHIGLHSERGAAGPSNGFLVEREVAGVTAACALVSKRVFIEAGGFCSLLPGNFNDVDLCMKVASLGYQSYFTPYVELYHFESKSRDSRVAASEIRTAWGRWEHLFWDSPLWPTDPHETFSNAPESSQTSGVSS